ncbi:MAG: glycosyltransferase family 4 protein [Deltaproteobacteria bacterium]|nr:glycosyltransferase family 4 protein [Deltaproteobacteria bacterium]
MDVRGTYKGGGGPDKTILHSAAMHNSSKVEVLVTYIRQPEDREFRIADMARQLGIDYVDFVDRNLLDRKCIGSLRRVVRQRRITLVHTHDDKTLLYGALLKYLVPGLRIMHTCHSHAEYDRESFAKTVAYLRFLFRKRFILWLMKRHALPILTISEDTRQRLIRGGLKENDVQVLYNGIDIASWSRSLAEPVLRKELNLAKGDLLVGTVARITYDKDLPTFFEVVRQVTARMPNVKFVVVGDGLGNELEKAKSDAAGMGLGHVVHFTGHRTDLSDIYASFDLFLMTSRTEGLPNTILEAMALEVPVVSTDVGGIPEVVLGHETGLLCPAGDTASLADAVTELLQRPQLRSRMGRMARQRIQNRFNFRKRVQQLEAIYLYFAGRGEWPSF